jgi:hypothetical protein
LSVEAVKTGLSVLSGVAQERVTRTMAANKKTVRSFRTCVGMDQDYRLFSF